MGSAVNETLTPGVPASGSGTYDGMTYSWTWDGVGEAVMSVSGAFDPGISTRVWQAGFSPYFIDEPLYARTTLENNGDLSLWSYVGDWNDSYVEDGSTYSTAGWTHDFQLILESWGGGCDSTVGWDFGSTGSNLDMTLTIQMGDATVPSEDSTWSDVKALFR